MTSANTRTDIVQSYFVSLTASDISAIVSLFADDGFVVSPVLGTMPARNFYQALDEASAQNVLTVHQTMSSSDDRFHTAHFTYDWTLSDGSQTQFEGIDMFEFDDDDRISSMKIFYDTYPTRQEVGDKYQRPDTSS